jgi:hypothetical protein
MIHHGADGLLVKPEIAAKQLEADRAAAAGAADTAGNGGASTAVTGDGGAAAPRLNRYYGTVTLDAARVGRDAGRIAEEIIAHLAGLVGSKVTVTLEIEASMPEGVPENIVRTVTENGRTLNFTSQGFNRDSS